MKLVYAMPCFSPIFLDRLIYIDLLHSYLMHMKNLLIISYPRLEVHVFVCLLPDNLKIKYKKSAPEKRKYTCSQRLIVPLTGLSASYFRVFNKLYAGCLSSDWLLIESLSGIQSSSLRDNVLIIAFTSPVLHSMLRYNNHACQLPS